MAVKGAHLPSLITHRFPVGLRQGCLFVLHYTNHKHTRVYPELVCSNHLSRIPDSSCVIQRFLLLLHPFLKELYQLTSVLILFSSSPNWTQKTGFPKKLGPVWMFLGKNRSVTWRDSNIQQPWFCDFLFYFILKQLIQCYSSAPVHIQPYQLMPSLSSSWVLQLDHGSAHPALFHSWIIGRESLLTERDSMANGWTTVSPQTAMAFLQLCPNLNQMGHFLRYKAEWSA